jgi:hypothetical protein
MMAKDKDNDRFHLNRHWWRRCYHSETSLPSNFAFEERLSQSKMMFESGHGMAFCDVELLFTKD